jgi:hypothetical protein
MGIEEETKVQSQKTGRSNGRKIEKIFPGLSFSFFLSFFL